MVIQEKSDLFDNKEWTELKDNVVPFAKPIPKPGSKEPPTHNWLSYLKPETSFAAKPRNNVNIVAVEEWHVIGHSTKTTLLYTNLNVEGYLRVDTRAYSDRMELIEILNEPIEGTDE